MERYNSRTVDELGRLILHGDIRKKFGLETGGNVSFMLVDTIIILQKAECDAESACNICEVNDLGMICLPSEPRAKLGLEAGDKVAVYNIDNIIILKPEEKTNAA